jgi:hypothetical protein
MAMKRMKIGASIFGAVIAAAMMSGGDATADGSSATGANLIYGKQIPPDQIEFLSTPDRIMSVGSGNIGANAIWETLEHGEYVECLDCIPIVANLLWDANSANREIAAWWLRRRIFGVYGNGEVYEQVVNVLKTSPDATKRGYAASALGEFLSLAGVEHLSTALKTDQSPFVRSSAAAALGRLNDDGAGALSSGMGDGDESVRIASVAAAGKVNSFADAAGVAKTTGDASPAVRMKGAELLGTMHAKDAVGSLINLATNDANPDVRAAAAHSLGMLHDATARPALEGLQNDSNVFVQDAARIALRRL